MHYVQSQLKDLENGNETTNSADACHESHLWILIEFDKPVIHEEGYRGRHVLVVNGFHQSEGIGNKEACVVLGSHQARVVLCLSELRNGEEKFLGISKVGQSNLCLGRSDSFSL